MKLSFELNTHLDAFGLFEMLDGFFVFLVVEFLDSEQMPGKWILGIQFSGLLQVFQDFAVELIDGVTWQLLGLQETRNGDGVPLRTPLYVEFKIKPTICELRQNWAQGR